MLKFIIFILAFAAFNTARAQTPIPRVGDSCPTGTYKSGDESKPFKSLEVDDAYPRESNG